jgi:hypothetical protein
MKVESLNSEFLEEWGSLLFIHWKGSARNIIYVIRFPPTYVGSGSGYSANVSISVIFIELFFYAIGVDIKTAKDKSGKQAGFKKYIFPHKR